MDNKEDLIKKYETDIKKLEDLLSKIPIEESQRLREYAEQAKNELSEYIRIENLNKGIKAIQKK